MDVDSPNSLKRCSSAPHINNLLPTTAVGHHLSPIVPMEEGQSHQPEDNQSVESAQIKTGTLLQQHGQQHQQQNLANSQLHSMSSSSTSSLQAAAAAAAPHRESPPTSFSNIFAPRVRRFSASFSPLAVISNGSSSPVRSGSCTPGPRLTPRISQLRQEECADLSNSREVNHEREIHSAMQMSQSYEDLTLVTENWSFSSTTNTKHNDDLINPLHVALPSIGTNYCSSPSPTSRAGLGLQYPTTSPSPTRKYVTRRSMSPCPIRPSPLSSVKRKFDLEGGGSGGEGGNNYGNCYSPPPLKKIFTGADRGTSPVCQTPSPSPICPSPDSSTASFENGSNNASSGSGRITPKFFVTRLSASGQLFAGNGNGGAPPPASLASLNPQLVATVAQATTGPGIVTESPPSSSSSSSFMMMDCGVSSSSGGGGGGGVGERKQQVPVVAAATTTVSSSGEEGKIDCDEDITDLNVIGSCTSMATTESSEAAMEEVIKTTRALDSESELLDSRSSSVVSNCHRLSSSGSVGNVSENNNSAEGSGSLCPLSANGAASASSSQFMATNIEIAET
ncbi:serine-rich adhesin for platelets [Culex pipiens pallens]|uniref:serine-rich adhesin for platelets n=1 Tax=Culex pipiens pallens TaxID=42434 RepID=UPI001954F87A|nr:serine-rich adhesin for platelets [Culex pipiens pallens]